MKIHFVQIEPFVQIREKHIRLTTGKAMAEIPCLVHAFFSIEKDKIIDHGPMTPINHNHDDKEIDIEGKMILPIGIDSHKHLVYADTKEDEFKDRIKGLSYHDIAQKGGGILNSAQKLNQTPTEILLDEAIKRLDQLIKSGIGAIEIESGYGLDHEGEIIMLEVIKQLKNLSPIPIKANILAAHALMAAYKNDTTAHLNNVISLTLPYAANYNLAEYIDVICEKGYFNLEDPEMILKAAKTSGLKPKVQVNHYNPSVGLALGASYDVQSAHQLKELSHDDTKDLKPSTSLSVALSGCSFFPVIPYCTARILIGRDLFPALTIDYKPGSTTSGNINFVVALTCFKMGLLPDEAINTLTLNATSTLKLSDQLNSITKGNKANFIITKPKPNYTFMPYAFEEIHIEDV